MTSITPINLRCEVAFGADRDAYPGTWTWTDLTNRTTSGSRVKLYDQAITIQKGSADEASQAQPTTISFTLMNFDGAVTPNNPESTFYPNVARGTPVRFRVHGGSVSHLGLPGVAGSYASTPDVASLDVVGDLFIAFDVNLYTGREPPFPMMFASKWGLAGQRSWRMYLNTDGLFRFTWSVDGTASGGDEGNLLPLPVDLSGRALWAFSIDVNDTAGGKVFTWYTSTSGTIAGPWVVHETRTTSGTTSIFSSTTPVEVGSQIGGAGSSTVLNFCGEFNAFEMRAGGTGGTVVANPNFGIQTENAASFADTAVVPKTWTMNGSAVIERWHTRFMGEIASIVPRWPSGHLANNAEVEVQAAGALRRMSQGAKPINSSLYRAITSKRNVPNVIAYWPFEDGSDSSDIFSPTPGVEPMKITGTFSLAADTTLVASKPLMTVGSGETAFMHAPIPAIDQVVGVNWEVTRLVRIDEPAVSPSFTQIMAVDTTGRVATWRVFIDSTQLTITGLDADDVGVVLDTIPATTFMFDQWTMYILEITDDGVNVDWDFHVIYLPAGTGSSTSGTFVGNTGVPVGFRNNMAGPPSGIASGHLIITTGKDIGWLARADHGYDGEPATQRIRRLCDEENIPAWIDGAYDSSTSTWEDTINTLGVVPMGPQRQLTVVELLQEAAASDGGVLTEARHNLGLAYRARYKMQNQSVQLTWNASTRGVIEPFEPTLDDQQLRNDVTVSRTDGSFARATDQVSIDTDGLYDTEIELPIWKDRFLPSIAGWQLHMGTQKAMRYPSLSIELDFADDLVNDWVTTVLGDRVQVTGLPPEHPTDSVDQTVDGYSETISQFDWKVDMSGRPATAFDVGTVGTTTRADTEGSALSAAATATATSLSVAFTDISQISAPWTTSSAQMPFDASVGGEQVTVSAIADIVTTFGAVGTVAHGLNASVVPSLPAGTATGNLLLCFAAIRNFGTGTVNTPTGWSRWPIFTDEENVALFGKIATSSEAAPTVSFTGGVATADTTAQIARFGGTFSNAANLPCRWGRVGFLSAQDIIYPATRVPYANSLVIYVGWKADDWTSVASPGTEIGEPDTVTGDDQGIVWAYTIQTTPTDIADGSFVVTGGAAAITVGGVIVLRPDVQTFTVTRAVNSVSKAQTAGTDVRLWTPWTLALT